MAPAGKAPLVALSCSCQQALSQGCTVNVIQATFQSFCMLHEVLLVALPSLYPPAGYPQLSMHVVCFQFYLINIKYSINIFNSEFK